MLRNKIVFPFWLESEESDTKLSLEVSLESWGVETRNRDSVVPFIHFRCLFRIPYSLVIIFIYSSLKSNSATLLLSALMAPMT